MGAKDGMVMRGTGRIVVRGTDSMVMGGGKAVWVEIEET